MTPEQYFVTWIPHGINLSMSNHLTPRELEIMKLLMKGSTTKEVGPLLGITAKTCDTHRANIFRKLKGREYDVPYERRTMQELLFPFWLQFAVDYHQFSKMGVNLVKTVSSAQRRNHEVQSENSQCTTDMER